MGYRKDTAEISILFPATKTLNAPLHQFSVDPRKPSFKRVHFMQKGRLKASRTMKDKEVWSEETSGKAQGAARQRKNKHKDTNSFKQPA